MLYKLDHLSQASSKTAHNSHTCVTNTPMLHHCWYMILIPFPFLCSEWSYISGKDNDLDGSQRHGISRCSSQGILLSSSELNFLVELSLDGGQGRGVWVSSWLLLGAFSGGGGGSGWLALGVGHGDYLGWLFVLKVFEIDGGGCSLDVETCCLLACLLCWLMFCSSQ